MDKEVKDKNIFYLNVNLTNMNPAPILAYVVDQRDSNIVDIPEQWEMSIVRFQLSSELIPLFFPVIPNPGFPLQTNMSVTLNFAGNFFQQFVSVSPDEAVNGVFDFCVFIQQVNLALTAAFAALKAAFPAIAVTAAPLFYLNDSQSLISLYYQQEYLTVPVQVGLNQPLQQILDMPCSLRNIVPAPFGYDFEIALNNSANVVPNPAVGYPLGVFNMPVITHILQTSQEFRSLDEWSNIKSVVFSSSRVPVSYEYLPNLTTISQNSNVNDSFLPVLTDFDLAKDSIEPTRHTLQYVPSGEYRMISLKGRNGFSAVDVKAQYQTYTGQLYPVYLGNGTNMSLKIMFRRKPDYYTH